MEEAVGGGRGRWSAAIGLSIGVLLLSVLDALALVLLPLAILMVGWPSDRRAKWLVAGVLLWLLGVLVVGGPFALLSRGWALLLGGVYLALSLIRPEWPVTSRALAATGVALGIGAAGLVLSGQAGAFDTQIREHFAAMSSLTVADLQERMPDSQWVAELRGATEQISAAQARLFPALLALQSLVALALASWWVRWLGRARSGAFELRRLRDFRFNDQLIWLLIAGLVLLVLPFGAGAQRMAINMIVFMTALYALRGLAVFMYLAVGSRSIPTMVFGVIALIFLYPVAFTAALLMGVGDTWLDVRRRVAQTDPS